MTGYLLGLRSPGLYEKDSFESLFISAPTQKDPTRYNGKGHTLEVVTYVGYEVFKAFEGTQHGARTKEYKELKQKIIKMFLTTLEKIIPGITRHILFCELGTPLTNAHFINCTDGAVYGTEKSYTQIGPLAYGARTEIEGLRLAGASTLSHGVAGAALSGLYAAASIMDCRLPELLKSEGQQLRTYPSEDQTLWPEWLKKKIGN